MRLDINYRKKSVRNTNTWKLNSTLLNNQEITEEIKEEIKKYLETNDNENTMTQNLWDAAKTTLHIHFDWMDVKQTNKQNKPPTTTNSPKT